MGERATREEVLAWMTSTGNGTKAAATHFGLNLNTVKGWRRRARQSRPVAPPSRSQGGAPPPAPPLHPPEESRPPPPQAALESRLSPLPAGGAPEPSAPPSAPPPSRGGAGLHPPAPARPGPPAPPSAQDIPEDDRELLRKAVRSQLRTLAFDATPFEAQAAATTLKILLGACPDILAFDAATAPPDEKASSDDPGNAADAVAASMGLEPLAPTEE